MNTLIIDFGMVVLIWTTQLIVYPSFTYFSAESLAAWHAKYTGNISIIVMPLMLLQVLFHTYNLYINFNWFRVIGTMLIGLAWINTFFYAVPLHQQITNGHRILNAAHQLVRINWYRTLLWSGVFIISLILWSKK